MWAASRNGKDYKSPPEDTFPHAPAHSVAQQLDFLQRQVLGLWYPAGQQQSAKSEEGEDQEGTEAKAFQQNLVNLPASSTSDQGITMGFFQAMNQSSPDNS